MFLVIKTIAASIIKYRYALCDSKKAGEKMFIRRLRKTLASRIINSFRDIRNKRRYVFAEWVPMEANDPDVIQHTTNVMALGGAMQIEYQDGGIRTIYPYGWNTSKDGNVLIMCYKDDGGVRSYRFDRINQFIFDDSTIEKGEEMGEAQQEQTQDSQEEEVQNPTLDVQDYGEEDSEDTLPQLPQVPQENNQLDVQQPSPFDEAIDTLDDSQPEQNPALPQETEPQDEENLDENQIIDEEPKAASFKTKRLLRKGDF